MTDEPPQEPNKRSRAFGRSLDDFAGPGGSGLYPAERKLLKCVAKGEECRIHETRPDAPNADKSHVVRPGFLRFLALGGDENAPVHEKGIKLFGAYIDGDIDLNNCKINVPVSLVRCHVAGEIVLFDADTQFLAFTGSHCNGLSGDRLTTTGSVKLDADKKGRFHATGEVRLNGASIGGNFVCRGGRFENENKGGKALSCDGLTTTGDVYLDADEKYHFHATGEVRLLGATIGGDFECRGGWFENKGGDALSCDRLKTTGTVNFDAGEKYHFRATGEVRLLGATIGGTFSCRGGRFENDGGKALSCNRLTTTGNVNLDAGEKYHFHATGEVRLSGASIGGNLSCRGGRFENKEDTKEDTGEKRCAVALGLQNAAIGKNLFLGVEEATNADFQGSVDFRFAHTGVLSDGPESWGTATVVDEKDNEMSCYLHLDGFTYDRIGSTSLQTAKARKAWLERQPPEDLSEDFKPQPYEQLAKVLRATGHTREAQDIEIDKRRKEMRRDGQRLPGTLHPIHPGNVLELLKSVGPLEFLWSIITAPFRYVYHALHLMWDWLKFLGFDLLMGYGYRVGRAFFIALIVYGSTWAFFYQAAEQGVMVPSDPRVFLDPELAETCVGENWTDSAACTDARMHLEHTQLQPALYALDVILPLAPLGQESAWEPAAKSFDLGILWMGHVEVWDRFALGVMWFNILFGWVVGLLIAAVVSGVVKRE